MSVSVNLNSLWRLHRRLTKTPSQLEQMKDELLDRYGQRLLQQTINNASGRPGPNIVTGRYVSSMVLRVMPNKREVANGSPQAARLEYGFVGTDRLGRNYHQPAFPHFRPALMLVGEEFKAEFLGLPKKAWDAS